ncbi:hypothetical protein ACOSQ4_029111 [Xanthoceras sorbifolium]
MCQPKDVGGMGFRDLSAFNQAMLAKQGWRILSNPSSLLAQVLKARYFPNSSFIDCALGQNPSFIWRSIMWGREVLARGVRWKVGDGLSISIYKDPWLPRPSSFKICSPSWLPEGATVSALLERPGFWCEGLVRRSFLPFEADIILGIPLSSFPRSDSVLWHYDKQGSFTVKSAYRLALLSRGDMAASCSFPKCWKTL